MCSSLPSETPKPLYSSLSASEEGWLFSRRSLQSGGAIERSGVLQPRKLDLFRTCGLMMGKVDFPIHVCADMPATIHRLSLRWAATSKGRARSTRLRCARHSPTDMNLFDGKLPAGSRGADWPWSGPATIVHLDFACRQAEANAWCSATSSRGFGDIRFRPISARG